jgi:hypothetical protein
MDVWVWVDGCVGVGVCVFRSHFRMCFLACCVPCLFFQYLSSNSPQQKSVDGFRFLYQPNYLFVNKLMNMIRSCIHETFFSL